MKIALLIAAALSIGAAQDSKSWAQPKTPDGQPDLQGVWSNGTLTPFERPPELAGKEFLTAQEATDYLKRAEQTRNEDRRDGTAEQDLNRAYNDAWYDWGSKLVPTHRSSIVIDPPDGRIPPLTSAAQAAENKRREARMRPPNGPEDRILTERCLLFPTDGPPMVPYAYNNNYRIYQIPGYVVIQIEMVHDVRVIPLDGRPHLSKDVRQWMGDSRGHWEGNTLVVDTTNFTDKTAFRGADGNLHVTERFTRVRPDMILYRFTVDDPTAFTRPWTGELPLNKAPGPIYEYACHEGNYGMVGILAGARADDAAKAGSSK